MFTPRNTIISAIIMLPPASLLMGMHMIDKISRKPSGAYWSEQSEQSKARSAWIKSYKAQAIKQDASDKRKLTQAISELATNNLQATTEARGVRYGHLMWESTVENDIWDTIDLRNAQNERDANLVRIDRDAREYQTALNELCWQHTQPCGASIINLCPRASN